jgi:subtilase family serine protease
MRLRLAVSACAVCVLVMSAAGTALAAPPSSPGSQGLAHRPVCPPVSGPYARCDSQVRTHSDASPLATATYTSGYAPADLMSAYKLPAAPVSGAPTVAIVDAYDAPSAEADLGVYRAQFGLADCTTANGCFRKVNQRGVQNAPPAANSGWAQEISLDLDMVSAICPACHILLVEADSNSYANLGAAVNMAASMGATQISNSYGGSEGSGVTTYDSSYYNHPGIDVTVSSGDNGYGVEFPASSPHVTAVGGTSLSTSGSTRGWSESAWSGAGSGCSAYFAKPSWQTDTGCARRTVADVSAVADPNTGVAVYDSYPSGGQAGWMVFGGTSVASPIVAAVDALAGGRAPTTTYGAYPYTHHGDFFDIAGGSNGTCTAAYLCNAVVGYDGPTGVGTPNGTSAF